MEKEHPLSTVTGVATLQLNDGKAGMQGLDKEAINKVILEASRGTPYFAFQEKRQVSIDSKVCQLKEALGRLTQGERKNALQKMDALGVVLEAQRDLSHSIVHIDMDAFYAAVETQDNPALKGKPMAVGSASMLSTSNYEARRFGVRAAMPGFIAKKLCPQLILVPCHFDRYKEVSRCVKDVVLHYDPDMCAASLDEMYLDLTEYVKKEHKRRLHFQFCVKDSDSEDINGKVITKESLQVSNGCEKSIANVRDHDMPSDEIKEIHLNNTYKKRSICDCENDSLECSANSSEMSSESKKRKHDEDEEDFKNDQRYNISNDWMQCMGCNSQLTVEERDQLAYEIVNEIREKIFLATGLTASAGIAPNVMLAKVGSDQNKPNGQFQIRSNAEDVKSFTATLPVKKVSGIGPVQGQILNALGIQTCSDMWAQRDIVACLFTSLSVDFYMRVAKGIGSTTVKSEYVRKSIGVEQTFKEIQDREELHRKCLELCEEAVEDLQLHNMVGKVVVLKLKTTSFKTLTRNQSLSCHTADMDVISGAAKRLLDLEMAALSPMPLRLRLMGIRIANLIDESSVMSAEKHTTKIKDFLKLKASHVSSQPPFTLSASTSKEESTELFPVRKNCELSTEVKEDVPDYTCPVCNVKQHSKSLADFNSHIDNCLNRSTIKEILAEETLNIRDKQKQEGKPRPKKIKLINNNRTEKRIEDYFN